ncbi:MAG: DNA repair protein RadA, partial [Bdellovibrionales bacterium]|nr:DNA repair protein RadA [Bdellovibrionales bacterium]
MYVSGEESALQIQKRAQRLGIKNSKIHLLCQTNIEDIIHTIDKQSPQVVMIDSIQTMHHPNLSSIPGSVSQVREVSDRLVRYAKDHNITFIIVGHVTKEGSIAGPMILEHLVDTVLHFEGSPDHTHRILRCLKNRFGPTFEMGIFEMHEQGLVEIQNPSEYFLPQTTNTTSGNVIYPAMEGSRAWMVEVQALATSSTYGTPIRNVVGMDKNRLTMLLAVLEKRGNLKLYDRDLYVNVVGGLKITEPAIDLAVVAAIISSVTNTVFPPKSVVFGEVGLSGEIRPTQHFESRVREATKLGMHHVYAPLPKGLQKKPQDAKMTNLAQIQDLLDLFSKIRNT